MWSSNQDREGVLTDLFPSCVRYGPIVNNNVSMLFLVRALQSVVQVHNVFCKTHCNFLIVSPAPETAVINATLSGQNTRSKQFCSCLALSHLQNTTNLTSIHDYSKWHELERFFISSRSPLPDTLLMKFNWQVLQPIMLPLGVHVLLQAPVKWVFDLGLQFQTGCAVLCLEVKLQQLDDFNRVTLYRYNGLPLFAHSCYMTTQL